MSYLITKERTLLCQLVRGQLDSPHADILFVKIKYGGPLKPKSFNTTSLQSMDQALISVDSNLDECIKALDSGDTTLASEHCKMADQALETFIGKQNSSKGG